MINSFLPRLSKTLGRKQNCADNKILMYLLEYLQTSYLQTSYFCCSPQLRIRNKGTCCVKKKGKMERWKGNFLSRYLKN